MRKLKFQNGRYNNQRGFIVVVNNSKDIQRIIKKWGIRCCLGNLPGCQVATYFANFYTFVYKIKKNNDINLFYFFAYAYIFYKTGGNPATRQILPFRRSDSPFPKKRFRKRRPTFAPSSPYASAGIRQRFRKRWLTLAEAFSRLSSAS